MALIEDAAEHANDCAEKGIKVILINRPWNLNERVHPNVKRAENWEEVLKHLEENEHTTIL